MVGRLALLELLYGLAGEEVRLKLEASVVGERVRLRMTWWTVVSARDGGHLASGPIP